MANISAAGPYPLEKVELYAPAAPVSYPYPPQGSPYSYPSQGSSYPVNPSFPGEKDATIVPFPGQSGVTPYSNQMSAIPYSSPSPMGGTPTHIGLQPYQMGGPHVQPGTVGNMPYPQDQPYANVQSANLQGVESAAKEDEPSKPSAPPLTNMDSISGYEDISFDPGFSPPPAYDDAVKEPTEGIQDIKYTPLSEEQARNELMDFVSKHCCYGKKAARNMVFSQLEVTSNFQYNLETFTEKRSSAWSYVPFDGNPIDGPTNGPAPGPWDIPAEPPSLFEDKTTELEVPHTASVKQCHTCLGNQRVVCKKCSGMGNMNCTSCNGQGQSSFRDNDGKFKQCTWCQGRGKKSCSTCNGSGQVKCTTCSGSGQLKCYIKLTITWQTHEDDYILKKTSLDEENLRQVSGNSAFEEEQARVWPIKTFPENEINKASDRLINEHLSKYAQERVIMQRQSIDVIPVTQVHYVWKEKEDIFYISGVENIVYFENYPQKCCWGCTIL